MADSRINYIRQELQKAIQSRDYERVIIHYDSLIKQASAQQVRKQNHTGLTSLSNMFYQINSAPIVDIYDQPYTELLMALKPSITDLAKHLRTILLLERAVSSR